MAAKPDARDFYFMNFGEGLGVDQAARELVK
jgi:hypothetical protein